MAEKNELKYNKRYLPCTIGDIADSLNISLATIWSWITTEDLHAMIDLGYRPNQKKMQPAVVKFLREKFMDVEEEIA